MSAQALGWRGGFRSRVARRSLVVCVVLAALVLGVLVLTLSTGDFVVPLPDVVAALTGGGSRAMNFIVVSLRLPRALTAIGAGAALGVSGTIFQSITRNPLGSPDVIGFTEGASAGAVIALTIGHAGAAGTAIAAVVGGFGTAVAVYLLAFRGGVQGYRLVLVGVGVSATLLAVVRFLLTRADLDDAFSTTIWLLGSLNGAGFAQAAALGVALAIALPAGFAAARRINVLEMGDDVATALGVRPERARLLAVGVAVLLAAVATACTGPVAFVALAAPQLARRLTRASGIGIAPAAVMGALVLLVSDYLGQHLFSAELPVGACTGVVGGLYLAWLLARQWKRSG
jgi:iron complex transport system permease protein